MDQVIGHKNMIGDTMVLPDKAANQWYVGKGPLSLLDLTTGTIRWTIPCDQTGFLMMDRARLLSGDRLLIAGPRVRQAPTGRHLKSRHRCDEEATARLSAIRSKQGTTAARVQWRGPRSTKPRRSRNGSYDGNLGSWARLPENRGGKKKGKRQQLATMLVTQKGEFDEAGIYEPDRLGIVGEGWECVNLADGASTFKTEEKLGILRGAYDGRVFFRRTRRRSARTPLRARRPCGPQRSRSKSDQIYTVDDLVTRGDGVPDGVSDLLVADMDRVSRVSSETGRAAWTIARRMDWWGSKHACPHR